MGKSKQRSQKRAVANSYSKATLTSMTSKQSPNKLYNSTLHYVAILSGCCGLGYEVIYVRMFSNIFGDAYVISAVLLTAIFLGIAFGAFNAARFIGKLGLIEILIGVYSIAIAALIHVQGFSLVALFSADEFINAMKLYALLLPPTFLIGTCIPLFSEYLKPSSTTKEAKTFTSIYALYNLGAIASIFLVEFYLFRQFGILATVITLASINISIGLYIHFQFDQKINNCKTTRKQNSLFQLGYWKHQAPTLLLTVLFLLSFASGMFQLYSLQLVAAIFGPLKENFALVLISAILGVAIGASIYRTFNISLKYIALAMGAFLSLSLLSLGFGIETWAKALSNTSNNTPIFMIKLSLILCFCLPVFTFAGMLVPSMVSLIASMSEQNKEVDLANQTDGKNPNTPTKTDNLSGLVLGISSIANGMGAFFFVTFFYENFSLPSLGLLITGIIIAALIIETLYHKNFTFLTIGMMKTAVSSSLIILIAGTLVTQTWPHKDLSFGYKTLTDLKNLNFKREHYSEKVEYKSKDQNASLVYLDNGTHHLVFNGYQSLSFGNRSRSDLHEALVAASPVIFAQNTNSALIFGLGTGISAGSAANLFAQVDVVEINPAILNIPKHYSEENFQIEEAQNVSIKLEDGITTLVSKNKTYDVIINTVTSPKYYSAVKMYTKDFFDVVSSSLNKNGIYSSWFDLNIGSKGISIMLNTLEASFKQCRYFVMSSGYFNVICSNDNLKPLSQEQLISRYSGSGIEQSMRKYKLQGHFPQFLLATEIEFDKDFFSRTSNAINTLNQPTIEFANLEAKQDTQETLNETLERNIGFQKLAYGSNLAWKRNCRVIEFLIRDKIKACH